MKGDDGMEYKIISDGKNPLIQYGQFMEIHIGQYYNNGKTDSLLTDSRTSAPLIEVLDSLTTPPPYFKILKQLRKGDSLVIRILSDSAFKRSPESMPPFIKKGHYLLTTVKVQNIYATQAQADSARQLGMIQAQEKAKANDAVQIGKDDKLITEYFAKNNIKAVKGAKGTYVEIIQQGSGPLADTNSVIRTNYTGRVLNGTKAFDSNTDPAFNHVTPYLVNMTNDPSLGQPTIPGWYDGLALLNKGSKARFYIPSPLAYGSRGMGADIAPNSILVFDIEVLDILNKSQAKAAIEAENKKMMEMQKRLQDSVNKAQGSK